LPDPVTSADLLAGLARLGVRAGERVLVHASLSRFGRVRGGATTVVDALLEAVGPSGTLLAPAFTFHNIKAERPFLDMRATPSGMGAIPEEVRRRAGAHRSAHLTHSVAAVGPAAAEFTREHSLTPCGEASAFWKLIRRGGPGGPGGGSVVLLGVPLNVVTLFHAVEERLGVPYMGFRDLHGEMRDASGAARTLHSQCHDPARPYDFNPLAAPLAGAGLLAETAIGGAICRRVEAPALWEYLAPRIEREPEFLARKTEESLKIPVAADGSVA